MKIAVITPYYKETEAQLLRCHRSVKAQTVACDHFMVADGYPQPVIAALDAVHVSLPVNMNDYGDTPRMIASGMVATLGYDAVVFLDADNWFEPEHVEILVKAQEASGAAVVTCGRLLRRSTDSSALGTCIETDGTTFCDTNCYLITRVAFPLLSRWGFKDPAYGIIGDRVLWMELNAHGLTFHHCPTETVNYVTTFATHYLTRGEAPPEDAKEIVHFTDGSFKMMLWVDAERLRSGA